MPFSHLVLPASVLGYASMAYIARMTRSFMLEQLGQEYVLAARIKGCATRRRDLAPRLPQHHACSS